MSVLTLILRQRTLEYAGFVGAGAPVMEGSRHSYDRHTDGAALCETLRRIAEEFRGLTGGAPDVVAVRASFGGAEFPGPVVAGEEVLDRLQRAAANAPLHVPATRNLAACCGRVFGPAPVVLVFETSFFAALPERESSYGLAPETTGPTGLRRYGFHGIYHDAACRHMARRVRPEKAREAARLLSIVLEPKPEVSAVFGNRPLTVTSGATPLEGIPGETSGGELDAGIVLALAREKGWGPEQINAALTRESGLLGLAGRRMTFADLFDGNAAELEPMREIIRYRLLLACGAGVAALSGLDGIVFSGRYAGLGRQIGPWLAARLRSHGRSAPPPWESFDTPLNRLLADAAIGVGSGLRPAEAAA